MPTFQPLVADRVLLRRLEVGDAPVVEQYRRDPLVARFQGWGVVDPGEIERDLVAMATRFPCDLPGAWFQLAIAERDGGAIAGDLGVRVLGDAPDTAEIGYTVAPAYQRRGYAGEAVGAACRWLLGPRALARVIAVMDGRNAASIAVAERAGFTRCASFDTRHRGVATVFLTYERRGTAA